MGETTRKRGPKPYEPGGKIMPYAEIASRLGVSVRTVHVDYHRAIEKLKREPGAFSILLSCVQAVAVERERNEKDIMQPTSVECRAEYCALHSGEMVDL
jgi:hypothetical protein